MNERFIEIPIILKEEQVKRMLVIMGADGLEKWTLEVERLHKRPVYVLMKDRSRISLHTYIKKLEAKEGESK